jgi:peptidoglycan hydrolase CwlO-like protein
VPAVLGGLIGAVAIAVMFVATDAPEMAHTSAMSALFDDRLLLSLARLLIVAAILYVLASIAVRVSRGQWVRAAGPVQTDAPTQQIADDQADLQQQLEQAQDVIEDLSERLRESVDARRTLAATMGERREIDPARESDDDDGTTI